MTAAEYKPKFYLTKYTPYFTLKDGGIILCIHPANEKLFYNVMSYLIGWTHTQNDPWGWAVGSILWCKNWLPCNSIILYIEAETHDHQASYCTLRQTHDHQASYCTLRQRHMTIKHHTVDWDTDTWPSIIILYIEAETHDHLASYCTLRQRHMTIKHHIVHWDRDTWPLSMILYIEAETHDHHLAENIFKFTVLYENCSLLIQISMNLLPSIQITITDHWLK